MNSRYAYFTDNTLAQVVNRSLTTTIISQDDYLYDAYANRRQQTSTIIGTALTHAYTFDALDRLLTVKQTVPLDATKDETYEVKGQVFYYHIDPENLVLWPDLYDSNSPARFITSLRAAMGARTFFCPMTIA